MLFGDGLGLTDGLIMLDMLALVGTDGETRLLGDEILADMLLYAFLIEDDLLGEVLGDVLLVYLEEPCADNPKEDKFAPLKAEVVILFAPELR